MTIPVYERAKSRAAKLSISKAVLNLFVNYQGLSIAKALKDCSDLETPEAKLYTSSLVSYFTSYHVCMSEDDIINFIHTFENTIDYFYWTMSHVWNQTCLMKKLLASSHDMPQKILHAYRDSMVEINNIAGFSLPVDFVRETLKDKHILDFGCGGGFLLRHFVEKGIPVASYIGVDREDILSHDFLHSNFGLKPAFEARLMVRDGFDEDLSAYDVIWLGEVLHGKSDKRKFIDELVGLLKKGQKIVVSELDECTARSQFFDVKMFLHTGAMETVASITNCLHEATGLKVLSTDSISFYHTATTAEVL